MPPFVLDPWVVLASGVGTASVMTDADQMTGIFIHITHLWPFHSFWDRWSRREKD